MSRTGIKARCQIAGLRPKLALDFCRLLRVAASSKAASSERRLLEQLNILDERTMRRLLRRAGISRARLIGMTPAEFLGSQRLVTEPDYIAAISQHLGGACAGKQNGDVHDRPLCSPAGITA